VRECECACECVPEPILCGSCIDAPTLPALPIIWRSCDAEASFVDDPSQTTVFLTMTMWAGRLTYGDRRCGCELTICAGNILRTRHTPIARVEVAKSTGMAPALKRPSTLRRSFMERPAWWTATPCGMSPCRVLSSISDALVRRYPLPPSSAAGTQTLTAWRK
jgi:hypothetical protein